MNRQFWVDGFNFFHHWDSTKGLLRPDSGYDIVRAIERAIRILSRHIGNRTRYTIVYLDGGLERHETHAAGMRIRYCGPGRKADDRMADDLADLGVDARLITAVSNDRELKARLKALGGASLGVGEYLSLVEGKKQSGNGKKTKTVQNGGLRTRDADEVLREKCRSLTPAEVRAWLDFFGGDVEA